MTTLTTNENRTPLRIVAAIIAISVVASLFLCWLVYYHAPADVTGTRLLFLPALNALLNAYLWPERHKPCQQRSIRAVGPESGRWNLLPLPSLGLQNGHPGISNSMSRGPTVANSALEIRAGGLALIDDSGPERTSLGTWILKDPEKVMVAATPEAVAETLAKVDQTRADHHWVALLDYELGFWLEPKLFHLRDFQHPPLTVISFLSARWLSRAHFDEWLQEAVRSLPKSQARAGTADLRMTNDFSIYSGAVRRILQHIGAGDCYQVNFTWSLDFRYFGSPLALYQLLRVQQPVHHGAFVQLADCSLLSLSPEFFSNGGIISCGCVR